MMNKKSKVSATQLKDPVMFLAFGLGSGLSPVAPGTAGTLITIPLVLLLQQAGLAVYLAVTLLIVVTGASVCSYASRKLNVHDHSGIVYDEVAGFLLTMLFVPQSGFWLVTGFILFRFFDAVKPWPISWLDRHVHGGTGIMLDDIVAGLISCLCLHGLIHIQFDQWLGTLWT
jgi:phosphatidylglycerophosphatase A